MKEPSFGNFYVMLVSPDLSKKRVKLGFAQNVDRRRKSFSTISPTIEIVKSWPCFQEHEKAVIYHVTRSCCRKIGREVFDFESVEALIESLDAAFSSDVSLLNANIPTWAVRIPPIYRKLINKLAKQKGIEPIEQVKIAIEEYLAKEGLWPPPAKDTST